MNYWVLIADDHSMIRKGLKLFLQMYNENSIIHEVGTCNDLMKELIKNKYTHLILDIIMPDGNTLEVIPNIRKVYPELQIMIFSMQPPEIYADALKQYGITNYMSKSLEEDQIIEGLSKFMSNQPAVSMIGKTITPLNPFSQLAPRELEILHYVLRGLRTKEIGDTLNLKMSTISTIKHRIFEKTGAGNFKELLELASLYNLNY
jgi:two-component system invasion response regulator UvrY